MRLTLWLFGAEVFALELEPTASDDDGCSLDGGTTSSYPIGYAPSYGDQRWEQGAGGGEL